MKIEMCETTSITITVVTISLAVCFVAFLIFRYNALAYEKGYTQQQLRESQETVWVKPQQPNTNVDTWVRP
jgi:hypothetical protein